MSIEPIVRILLDAQCNFECKTGIRPTTMYLGGLEFMEFKEFLSLEFAKYHHGIGNPVSTDLEWNGMLVLEVIRKNHIGFS